MNCTQSDALIQLGVDGRLSNADRSRLDTHLAGCAACRAAWDEYRRLSQAASAWTQRAVVPDDPGGLFTAQVMARIGGGQASLPPRLSRRTYALAALAGSALTALSFWAGPHLSAFFPPLSMSALPSPHALLSPNGLWPALGRIPQDALGAWQTLTAAPLPLPGWIWSVLAATLGVNALFVRRARHFQRDPPAR